MTWLDEEVRLPGEVQALLDEFQGKKK